MMPDPFGPFSFRMWMVAMWSQIFFLSSFAFLSRSPSAQFVALTVESLDSKAG